MAEERVCLTLVLVMYILFNIMGVGGREMYKEYRELYLISIKKKRTKHIKMTFTFLDKKRIVILVCHA